MVLSQINENVIQLRCGLKLIGLVLVLAQHLAGLEQTISLPVESESRELIWATSGQYWSKLCIPACLSAKMLAHIQNHLFNHRRQLSCLSPCLARNWPSSPVSPLRQVSFSDLLSPSHLCLILDWYTGGGGMWGYSLLSIIHKEMYKVSLQRNKIITLIWSGSVC